MLANEVADGRLVWCEEGNSWGLCMEVVIKVWGVGGWRAGGRIAGEELGGQLVIAMTIRCRGVDKTDPVSMSLEFESLNRRSSLLATTMRLDPGEPLDRTWSTEFGNGHLQAKSYLDSGRANPETRWGQ